VSTTEAGRLTPTAKSDANSVSLQVVMESPRRLDELSCARIVGNLADAVYAAHKAGQPPAALTPAGIAVQADGKVALGAAVASPRYAAPETLRGGVGDRRSDVFALGVILWEALAHERLFDGADDAAITRAVLEAAVRPPSELNANVPAELDAICKRALAREPAERYPSAKVMAAEIDAVLGDAGYPESNDQIARFLAAMAAPAPGPTRPTQVVGAAPPPARAPRPGTQPPTGQPAASTTGKQRHATQPPSSKRHATSSGGKTAPLPSVAPAKADSAADTMPTLPPAAPQRPATEPPATAQPSATTPSSVDALWAPAEAIADPPPKPVGGAAMKPATTQIVGSFASSEPGAEKPRAPERSPLAATAFLGSNGSEPPAPATFPSFGIPGIAHAPAGAVAAPPSTEALPPVPPPAGVPAPGGSAAAAGPAPLFGPPEMPPPVGAGGPPAPSVVGAAPSPTAGAAHPTPGAFRPVSHPAPRPSIANADTVATPQVSPPSIAPVTQLGMPPGITVPPASAPAPLQTVDPAADEPFGDEHHADPAEVVAQHHGERGTGGRDVLAGWGWSTGSLQAISDDDDLGEVARASRRRLLIAIGGALGVIMIIVVVAFAFSGGKPAEQAAQLAPRRSTAGPAATEPSSAPAAAGPTGSTEPAAAPQTGAAASGGPPSAATGTIDPSAPPSAATATGDPSAPPSAAAGTGDPSAPPGTSTPSTTPPGAAQTAATTDPGPSPSSPPAATNTTPPAPKPPDEAPADNPAKPAKPAKIDAARAALPDAATRKPEAKKPDPKKLEVKKPAEPRPPADKPVRRAPPERVARANNKAQPVDPYASPSAPALTAGPPGPPAASSDRSKPDPATAYKTGIQQYAHGDTTGALATFRASAAATPGFAPTWRGLGLVYEKLGNKGMARLAFKRYLQLAPGAGDADQIRDRMERLGS